MRRSSSIIDRYVDVVLYVIVLLMQSATCQLHKTADIYRHHMGVAFTKVVGVVEMQSVVWNQNKCKNFDVIMYNLYPFCTPIILSRVHFS